jgi:AGZA family xanthine/uracil permease-like MFS transporter
MFRQISSINWGYIGDAIPSFVTVMFIPFGYSAAYGLIAGLMAYTALNGMIYITKIFSSGTIVPDDEDRREYWTSKFPCYSVAARGANTWASQATWQAPLVLHS